MHRYALKIEYHGQGFYGWQRQNDLPTVQTALEPALAQLEPALPSIAAAGRTDTGVHGLGQVAHCDMRKTWDAIKLKGALNYHLKPNRIAVLDCRQVDPDWHARFSAIGRDYLFRLVCRAAPVTHDAGLVWQSRHPLDVHAMRTGAASLLVNQYFTTFLSTLCQAQSPIKNIHVLANTTHDLPEVQHNRNYV